MRLPARKGVAPPAQKTGSPRVFSAAAIAVRARVLRLWKVCGVPAALATERAQRAPAGHAMRPQGGDQSEVGVVRAQQAQPVERAVHLVDGEAARPQREFREPGAGPLAALRLGQFGLGELVGPFEPVLRPMVARRARSARAGQPVERPHGLDETQPDVARRPGRRRRDLLLERGIGRFERVKHRRPGCCR